MKIYQPGEENYEETARLLIDEGIVGFNTYSSSIKKIYEQTYANLSEKGYSRSNIVRDFTMTNEGYVYFLRNQDMFNRDEAIQAVKTEQGKLKINFEN